MPKVRLYVIETLRYTAEVDMPDDELKSLESLDAYSAGDHASGWITRSDLTDAEFELEDMQVL